MMRALADLLEEGLGLQLPPVAVTFVDEPPANVRRARRAPSACTFWRQAETEVFYADADAHGGCSVGAYVMGLPQSAAASQALSESIELMASVGYLDMAEVPAIPQIPDSGAGIVYGPLAKFPIAPSAVLVWATPAQAMLLEEALRTTAWSASRGDRQLFGRPACAALAQGVNTRQSAFSLGCAGMRTFTEVPPELGLVAIPSDVLGTLEEQLRSTLEANDRMLAHYRIKKETFA